MIKAAIVKGGDIVIKAAIVKDHYTQGYGLVFNGHFNGNLSFVDVRRILRKYHADNVIFDFYTNYGDHYVNNLWFVDFMEALELMPYNPYGTELVGNICERYGRIFKASSILHGYIPINTAKLDPYCGKYGMGFTVRTHRAKDVCLVEYYCTNEISEDCLLPFERDAIIENREDRSLKSILRDSYKKL